MVTRRTAIPAVIGMLSIETVCNAQRIHIGNAGVIPNAGMTPPTILQSTVARYTDEARNRGIEGTVTVEALVQVNGGVKVSRILKGLGSGLDEVARSTVAEWTITPATRNGLPVEVVSQIDVAFSLRSANAIPIGPGMTAPGVLRRVDPQYTDEARKAGLNGTAVLQAVIRTDGTVDILRIVRGQPLGLTENAIDALKQWKFSPGAKNGQDVDVVVNIEINFNLLK